MVRQKSVLLLFLFDRYFDREMNLKKNGGKDNADYRCHDPSSFSLVTKLPNWQNVFLSCNKSPSTQLFFVVGSYLNARVKHLYICHKKMEKANSRIERKWAYSLQSVCIKKLHNRKMKRDENKLCKIIPTHLS